jgi:nitroreductase
MNFLDIAKKRYSVRKFKNQPVEKEYLDKILEAARVAPTGANKQPFKLLVIQQKEGLEKIKKATTVYGAPLVIIVCGDHSKVWKRPFDGKSIVDIDTSIVTDHMMLQATELGLGSLWICYFKPDVIRTEFSIPQNLEPVNILALGYANDKAASPDRHDKARLPVKEIACFEKMGG